MLMFILIVYVVIEMNGQRESELYIWSDKNAELCARHVRYEKETCVQASQCTFMMYLCDALYLSVSYCMSRL